MQSRSARRQTSHRWTLLGATSVAVVFMVGLGSAPVGRSAAPATLGTTSDEPTAAQIDWLRAHAVELKTVEAGNGFDDLQPLKAIIGGARVVGLGEGTHGTREYFQAKHRLLEFLASEMGFSIFSIEANMPEAYALNDYVLGGDGDVNALLAGMYFWTWQTEEVSDMVRWMRRFNAEQAAAGSPARVQFTGFDMQYGKVALRIAQEFLEAHDPEYLAQVRPSLARLAVFEPQAGAGFGCATGRFPVEQARGKKVHLSGWIKTEGPQDASAALWWRVDGPTPVFDNMGRRAPRGTADWQNVSIELAVPADAEAIYFGLLKVGDGRAWFDDLSIHLDGQPWSSDDFDLGFERPQPDGIIAADPRRRPGSPAYPAALDEEVVRTGKSCMRIERADGILQPAEADSIARSVLEHMTASRERYLGAADARAVDWAIQNARVVNQWTGLGTDPNGGYAQRDRCMAENIGWILDQNPGAKVVVWAHNSHVRAKDPHMGSHLRRMFGAEYVNAAFCASHGQYYARPSDGGTNFIHSLADPIPGSFESMLQGAGKPILLVDLRAAVSSDPGSAWLAQTRGFGGTIGALQMDDHYLSARLKGEFDLLLYVRDTTPARQLPTGTTPR